MGNRVEGQGGGTPPGELLMSSPITKFYWVNREVFVVGEDQILYRKKTDSSPRRVVVPKTLRENVWYYGMTYPRRITKG